MLSMQNLTAKRSRAAVAAAAAYDSKEDRISNLPEPILNHILCFLDQRTAATTSVLSKPWRYLWCTRPQIDFCHGSTVVAGENKESLLSVLDRTLRFYHDRKIPILNLTLHLSPSDGETYPFLINWFRILAQCMGVNVFHLHFLPENLSSNIKIQLPSSIFGSESVQNLSLKSCALKPISAPPVHLNNLQFLVLEDVDIPEEILDDILSNSRFLEYLSLTRCTGFKRIELKPSAANLKEFHFCDHQIGATSIAMGGDDIPTLKIVRIIDCLLTIIPNRPLYFSHLTHLKMRSVELSSDSFSCHLPCLEELRLSDCSGIKEFSLSSPSMKLMKIINTNSLLKVTVDAPSIDTFHYIGDLPKSTYFSFSAAAATSSWRSCIDLTYFVTESSLCLNDLIGLLKALSQSEISLTLDDKTVLWLRNQIHNMNVSVSYVDLPVEVARFSIVQGTPYSPFPNEFLNTVFHMIRPRTIYVGDFRKHVLEGASMQFFYWNGGKWQPFQPTSLSILASKNGEVVVQTCPPVETERTIQLIMINKGGSCIRA